MNNFRNIPLLSIAVFFLLSLKISICEESIHHITILHHNDFHAANTHYVIKQSDGDSIIILGAAGLKSLADAVEDTSAPSLWLYAGDDYTGTPISSMTKGASQIQICKRLGFDIAVLGNHDFDYGLRRAEAYRDSLNVPVLGGANVHYGNGTPFAEVFRDTVIAGTKIRIAGVISADLKLLTTVEATGSLIVIDAVAALKPIVPSQDRLFIVLSHMGYSADSLLAVRMPEIDLIVGGHQHKILKTPHLISPEGKVDSKFLTGDDNNRLPGTVIVQAGSRGRYLGVLSLAVKNGDIISAYGQLLQNDGNLAPPDEQLASYIDELEEKYTRALDEVIAVLRQPLTRSREGESALGRWITDIYRKSAGADIAFDNPGGLRMDLQSGHLKARDIWEAVPFGNTLIICKMSGEEIKSALEFMVSGARERLVVSGLTAEIDLRSGKAEKIIVGGKPIELNSTYKVVFNSYIFGHFDKYFGFDRGDRFNYDTGLIDRMVIIESAEDEKNITAPSDVRIRFTQ